MTKLEKALEAVKEVFGDTSVSKRETLDSLKDIASDVETYIDAIESDMRREEE